MSHDDWRVAKSLETLRDQVNAQFPGRDKSSDGSIGNAEHSARESDHNPDDDRVVKARDITHDPRHGMDAGVLAAVLIASRDPRIKYIIWNRQIIAGDAGPSPWKARKYIGANPHTHHVHISVKKQPKFFDDATPWAMPGLAVPKTPTLPQPPNPRPVLMIGNTGEAVKELQRLLGFTGNDVDGLFGPKTRDAVKAVQRKAKLDPDGKVGSYTWPVLATK